MGVLIECFEVDEKKINVLLICRYEQFGEVNCLKIVVKFDNKQFILYLVCQDFFCNVWMGNLVLENGIFWVCLLQEKFLKINVFDIFFYLKFVIILNILLIVILVMGKVFFIFLCIVQMICIFFFLYII